MKTIGDLISVTGYDKPFVFYVGNNENLFCNMFTSDGFEVTDLFKSCSDISIFPNDLESILPENFELIDWFENEIEESKTCFCDFYKVLLVSGCQCGGK